MIDSIKKDYIAELHNRIEELERFRFMLDSTFETILILELPSLRVIDVNESAVELFGICRKKLLELNLNDLFGDDLSSEISCKEFSSYTGSKTRKIILANAVSKDGKKMPVEISVTPTKFINGTYAVILVRDITERVIAEEALTKFKFIVDNAGEEFFLIHPDGRMVYVNEAAAKSLGYSFSELTRLRISDIDPNYSKEIFDQVFQWLKNDSVPPFETLHRTKDGRLIPKEMQAVYLKSGEKEYICAFGRDITKRKQYEHEIIKAKDLAERSDHLKSEFLAQMSHEIRTPVNTILSFISLIKEELQENFTEDLKVSFKALDKGSKRLIKTIDSLLNMSQIHTGNYDINTVSIDLVKDVLDNLLFDFHGHAISKGLKLRLVNKSTDAVLTCDQYSVTQIFINLLDNAIKYTHYGRIEIMVYNDSYERLCVDVKDTGIGITEEYLPELFDAFSQEDKGYRRRFDGTGLGLALVAKYAELNNAEVKVKSRKNEGTTFTVVFKSL